MHRGFEIPIQQLVPSARLKEDLQLDSLDAVDMVVQLEEQLKLKVSGEKIMAVRTLGDIYLLIEELCNQSGTLDQPRPKEI